MDEFVQAHDVIDFFEDAEVDARARAEAEAQRARLQRGGR